MKGTIRLVTTLICAGFLAQGCATRPTPAPAPTPAPKEHKATSAQAIKKQQFFARLRPIVMAENARLARDRQRILHLKKRKAWLSGADRRWLMDLATRYRMPAFDLHKEEDWQTLLRRVDEIPVELVLAQAANESAWGTSRFARMGNNYFGQWCYRKGCGIVPRHRAPGAKHEVARFDSIEASVASYMHNLNTLGAYRTLRLLRAQARARGEEPQAEQLAEGLVHYSARGEAYVRTLQAMIRHNRDLMNNS